MLSKNCISAASLEICPQHVPLMKKILLQKGFLKLSLIVFFLSASVVFLHPSVSCAKTIKAPSWEGVEWINLAPGKDSLDVNELKGRVIYLSFFQKW